MSDQVPRTRMVRPLKVSAAIIPSTYGMHVTAIARAGLDLEQVAAELAKAQVNIHSLRRYYAGRGTQPGLVFGYGAVDLPQIRKGLSALRQTLVCA
jgi:GntR family transcriptional regulator/MocR family aminotransferase